MSAYSFCRSLQKCYGSAFLYEEPDPAFLTNVDSDSISEGEKKYFFFLQIKSNLIYLNNKIVLSQIFCYALSYLFRLKYLSIDCFHPQFRLILHLSIRNADPTNWSQVQNHIFSLWIRVLDPLDPGPKLWWTNKTLPVPAMLFLSKFVTKNK
jgi:hypothetical protein